MNHNIKKGIIIGLMALCASVGQAQSLWTSIEGKKKVATGLNVSAEAEYRTTDELAGTERWAGTVGLDYKLTNFLKAAAGYSYIHQREPGELTKKGNIVPAYWQPKHRGFFALTGSMKVGRFEFSLRERYQYTYRVKQYVEKYNSITCQRMTDEEVKSKGKHILRSRLEVEYDIKKSKFTPSVSCEVYSQLAKGCSTEKIRWTAGTSYKLSKKHSISAYYRYIDGHDDDDGESGHIIGIGYSVKL